MSLSIGLVGLPNAGKSSLFNALTSQQALVANYPFATIEPNQGLVQLDDKRLVGLAEIFTSAKTVPATINFTDIAGLIAGAHQGEGLGNQFLAHIRQTDLIVHVVNGFSDEINLKNNMAIIETELMLADMQTIDKQLDKYSKPAKTNQKLANLAKILTQAKTDLNNQIYLLSSSYHTDYLTELIHLNLLTLKPMLYVFNIKQANFKESEASLASLISTKDYIILDAKLETELNELSLEDKVSFLKEYNLELTGIQKLAQASFKMLDLMTFLTAGHKEVRAWMIPKNCLAPQAAGKIHSDMEAGFIAADIVNYHDLIEYKSWLEAKNQGKLRTEGRNYLMQTDDVVEFKFNKTTP